MSPDLKIKTALGSHYAGWALQHQFPVKLALFLSLPINSVLIMAQLCVNIWYDNRSVAVAPTNMFLSHKLCKHNLVTLSWQCATTNL